MGGASKLLGYINMHTSTCLAKVNTTKGWITVQINQGLQMEQERLWEMLYFALFPNNGYVSFLLSVLTSFLRQ